MKYGVKRGVSKNDQLVVIKGLNGRGSCKRKMSSKRKSSCLKRSSNTIKLYIRGAVDDDVSGECDHNSSKGYLTHDSKCYFKDNCRYEKTGRSRVKQMSMIK